MLQIPQHVLEKLRCSLCDSYLTTKPLMIRTENQQVCGKCYNLLPKEEKEKCVRQIGLESVAEIISFPCRYNTQGCPYTFKWCEGQEHESKCSYSDLSPLPDNYGYINTKQRGLHCETDKLKASFTYRVTENNTEFKNLLYTLDIKGNCDQSLLINDTNTNQSKEVEIQMDGTVYLGLQPELVCSDIKIKPVITQNIYESLRNYSSKDKICASCGKQANHNHCLLGHNACTQCKSHICLHCVRVLEKEAKTFCKNYEKGCRETLDIDSTHGHEANCQYNDYKCILEPCSVISTLPGIKKHIRDDHQSEIFQTNEVNRKFTAKDETFVILCYGSIFKCVYFYYKTFVEFYVMYIGSSEEAVNFCYEIIVNIKGYVISKKSRCSNWNTSMLEKGIAFERSELMNAKDKKLNMEASIKIINKKKINN